jgi:hypothetical protein
MNNQFHASAALSWAKSRRYLLYGMGRVQSVSGQAREDHNSLIVRNSTTFHWSSARRLRTILSELVISINLLSEAL